MSHNDQPSLTQHSTLYHMTFDPLPHSYQYHLVKKQKEHATISQKTITHLLNTILIHSSCYNYPSIKHNTPPSLTQHYLPIKHNTPPSLTQHYLLIKHNTPPSLTQHYLLIKHTTISHTTLPTYQTQHSTISQTTLPTYQTHHHLSHLSLIHI